MRIERITCEKQSAPAAKTGRVSLTDPKPAALQRLTVTVTTSDGVSGKGSLVGPNLAISSLEAILNDDLRPFLLGKDPRFVEQIFNSVESTYKPIGFNGIVARMYATVDFALWSIRAQSMNMSLAESLGNARKEAAFFVSDLGGPHRSADEIVRAVKPWLKKGAKGVLIEVGSGDVQLDADRVREVSEQIGEEAWIGVNACGRYDLGTSLALAHYFDDQGVGWFEEPMPISDSQGYNRLASRMETTLSGGASCQTFQEICQLAQSGSVRVLRPDPYRLGGLTPILKLAAIAEACHCTIVPVRCAEIMEELAKGVAIVPQYEREIE